MDALFAHTSDNAPSEVDIRTLDPFNDNQPNRILANNLERGDVTGYRSLAPASYTIELSSGDNSAVAGAFLFELDSFGGQSLACFASDDNGGVMLLCADAFGNIIMGDTVTDTDEVDLPTEFALEGNYPNPFNPSTTIQFDLPETAEVSVEIVDMLGRRVMTVPAQTVQAGADRTFEVNASNLASGVYVYRIIATMANDTVTKTGRMTLIK